MTPSRAEEGLAGVLSNHQDIGCYKLEEFTDEELTSLDSEGRCVITEHKIKL